MSIFRGPSAEDHHGSPAPNDSKTTSATGAGANEDSIVTRKCCTLCNLLVSFIFDNKTIFIKKSFSFFS
jgi:hypothetical protein